MLFGPKSSMQYDAIAVPYITPFLTSLNVIFEQLARKPANPPAKVSPAPVGSLTFSVLYIGQL